MQKYFCYIAEKAYSTKPKRTLRKHFNTFMFRYCTYNILVILEKYCTAILVGCVVYCVSLAAKTVPSDSFLCCPLVRVHSGVCRGRHADLHTEKTALLHVLPVLPVLSVLPVFTVLTLLPVLPVLPVLPLIPVLSLLLVQG